MSVAAEVRAAREPEVNPARAASSDHPEAATVAVKLKRRVYDPAPPPDDSAAWREIAAAGSWSHYRAKDILEAWESFLAVDEELERSLRRGLLHCFQNRLGKWLGNRTYGRNHDFWLMREDDFLVALLKPQSDAGIAIRASFVNFADWGTINLIREDAKHRGEAFDEEVAGGVDHRDAAHAAIDLRAARDRFGKGDKRRVECLIMQDMGYTQAEITKQTGAARETQVAWRAGFQAMLTEMGIG